MRYDFSKALDNCLSSIKEGISPDVCLHQYQSLKQGLEPLINTAIYISKISKIYPSKEFRTESPARLKAKIQEKSYEPFANTESIPRKIFARFNTKMKNVITCFSLQRRLLVPLMSSLLIAIAISLAMYSIPILLGQSDTLDSRCTLSVLLGYADVQSPGAKNWQTGADGMTLEVGSRVRTKDDSQAMLTFFEGTTIKLQPGTDIEIEKVKGSDDKSTEIVLKQWLGKTWSRVVKKIDPGSRYEIKTPSAYALVRGTMFETEVDKSGTTEVRTTEGLVGVGAEGKEVSVGAGSGTSVLFGSIPADPEQLALPKSEFVVTVSMPAVASICDPTSSSTGYLPSGISFNQIIGSQSTSPADGDQIIRIPELIAGMYRVILRGIEDGNSIVIYKIISDGELILERTVSYDISGGTEYFVPVEFEFLDSTVVGAVVGDIGLLGGNSPEKIIINRNMQQNALPIKSFNGITNPVKLLVRSGAGGSVVVPGEGEYIYEKETTVSLVAVADRGYAFLGWRGPVEDSNSTDTSITLNEDQIVTANFSRGEICVVTVLSTEGGSVVEPGQGVFMYEYGTIIDLVAQPKEGWVFEYWEGYVDAPKSAATTATIKHTDEIVAHFGRAQ